MVSRASKALHAEFNRKAKSDGRRQGFPPPRGLYTIIIRNEIRLASNRSIEGPKYGGKQNSKSRKSRSINWKRCNIKPSNAKGQALPRERSLTDPIESSFVQKRLKKRFRPRKIDKCPVHEKWLFTEMAKRPLCDLLPRNSEIHNFTSFKLTERLLRFYGSKPGSKV